MCKKYMYWRGGGGLKKLGRRNYQLMIYMVFEVFFSFFLFPLTLEKEKSGWGLCGL